MCSSRGGISTKSLSIGLLVPTGVVSFSGPAVRAEQEEGIVVEDGRSLRFELQIVATE